MIVRELINLIGFKVDNKDLEVAERKFRDMSNRMQDAGKKLTLFVTAPILGVAGASLKAASDVEQLDVAMTTMLGSAEAAGQLIKELYAFAAKTPFEIQNIGQTTKQLLAVGIEGKNIIPTLKALGDVSAGLSVPLERLVLNYGQVRAQQKLTGRELRDFTLAGVPILDQLGKQFGKTTAEIRDMVSAGKIGFKDVKQAFVAMSSEGGRFEDLMTKQSKTLGGLWSNFLDVLFLARAEFGRLIVETFDLKRRFEILIEGVGKAVQWFKNLSDGTKRLILLSVGLVAAIGPVLLILGTLGKLYFFMAGGLKTLVGLWTLFIKAGGPLIAMLKGITLAVAAKIAAIVALIAFIGLLIEDIWVWVHGGQSAIGDFLGTWENFKERVMLIFKILREDLRQFIEIAKKLIMSFIPDPVIDAWNRFKDIMVDIFSIIKTKFKEMLSATIEKVSNLFNRAKGFVKEKGKQFIEGGGLIGSGVENRFNPTPAFAGSGIGATRKGGSRSVNQNFNSNTNLTLTVPAAMSEAQTQDIKKVVKQAVDESNAEMVRNLETNNSQVEK